MIPLKLSHGRGVGMSSRVGHHRRPRRTRNFGGVMTLFEVNA